YDTGAHHRDGSYASDPLSSPSYTTGSHSRSGFGSAPSSFDSGSHDRSFYDTAPSAGPAPRSASPDPLTDPSFAPPAADSATGSPIWSSLDTGSYQRSAPPPGSAPGGSQPPFRDPAGTPPAFGTPPAPADGTPGGYGPSPYTTGSLGAYDTGAHHHADYPPPAPQGGAQPYPASPDTPGDCAPRRAAARRAAREHT